MLAVVGATPQDVDFHGVVGNPVTTSPPTMQPTPAGTHPRIQEQPIVQRAPPQVSPQLVTNGDPYRGKQAHIDDGNDVANGRSPSGVGRLDTARKAPLVGSNKGPSDRSPHKAEAVDTRIQVSPKVVVDREDSDSLCSDGSTEIIYVRDKVKDHLAEERYREYSYDVDRLRSEERKKSNRKVAQRQVVCALKAASKWPTNTESSLPSRRSTRQPKKAKD